MLEAMRPESIKSWLKTKLDDSTLGVLDVATTGVDVLYQTLSKKKTT